MLERNYSQIKVAPQFLRRLRKQNKIHVVSTKLYWSGQDIKNGTTMLPCSQACYFMDRRNTYSEIQQLSVLILHKYKHKLELERESILILPSSKTHEGL